MAKEYSRKEALKEAHKKEYEAKALSTEALKANLKYNLKYINTYLESLTFKKQAGEEINIEELEDLKAKAADALSLYGSVFNSIYRNISNENSKHELQITAAYISACAESLLKESSLE